jgi:acetyl-CoA C-acetyltransferase
VHAPGRAIDERTPVLVGAGTASDSAPVTELMTRAARAAADDAGAPALLAAVNRIALPQGSWALTDPARTIATRLGASLARTFRYEIGVSQQEIVNDALTAIGRGEVDVVLVVGGEARAWVRHGGHEEDGEALPPDVTVTRQADFVAPVEQAAGIVVPPVQQYALIENALGAHEHLDPHAQGEEVARLWARFNLVARDNPSAAFPAPRSAAAISTPGPRNRPLAHPYNVWHASQWTVDQAAALLFCSAGRAADAGVPRDRWVFPHVALHASKAVTLTARADLWAWPAMAVLGRAAADHIARPLAELPIAEVYSCFPSAVRVQQRALGLDPNGTPTVTGGMTFAGGPFNNYVLTATAAVLPLLRQEPSALGLLTTVCGMLSKPGLAVWSATPPAPGRGPRIADLAEAAAAATPTRAVASPERAGGPAVVASYTVTYDADDPPAPTRTAIVADLADGTRTAATCEDAAIARAALAEGLIGQTVHIERTAFTA